MLQKRVINALLISLLLISGIGFVYTLLPSTDPTTTPSPASATSSPIASINGPELTFEDLKGTPVLVNYWATWCMPCRIEIPELIALRNHYDANDLHIIGISMDDDATTALSYIKSEGINYPVTMMNQALYDRFGTITSIPTTLFLDKNGTVVRFLKGYQTEDTLKQILSTLL